MGSRLGTEKGEWLLGGKGREFKGGERRKGGNWTPADFYQD